eukprot:TRINITY_DN9444_c0_g2_i1.p2 TRINITY_DN9444_c0_g2~~TRINITY_DN9444_c0_g2_i1.p2  ORF type:complete len:199 (-),score=73.93 TRINITY_DN9444_c0_g2_i1:178-774(-)
MSGVCWSSIIHPCRSHPFSAPQPQLQLPHQLQLTNFNSTSHRPQEDDTMQVVVAVGSDIIVYEDYLHTPEFYTLIADLPAPCLALDAVGGSVGADLARALGDGATFVSYGELSGAAARLPASVVKAKGIKTADFCITKWTKGSSAAARQSMVDDIGAMIKAEELILFFEAHPFSNISYALDRYYEPFKYRKVLLDMSI